jgi:ribonuclease Z
MIPSEPPRNPQYGFLFFPPYRVVGYSIAGEESFVQIPELDVVFDIGRAARVALTSSFVALSHGHMDHSAGLAYYFSQRVFQGMGVGTVLCHPTMAEPIRRLMTAWIDVEAQRTPYQVVPMTPGTPSEEYEIKNNIFLRAFATDHTVPSLGFVVVEKRSKLREEFIGLPQERLVELKSTGQDITYTKEVPLVAYMGDTSPGDFFFRPDVANAKILISECTFTEPDHRDRAKIGKHLHIADYADILPRLNCENVVLTHVSRRSHLGMARQQLDKVIPPNFRDRVFLLMDGRTNRSRLQQQAHEAGPAAQTPHPTPVEGDLE